VNPPFTAVSPIAPVRPLSPGGRSKGSHYAHFEATRVAKTNKPDRWKDKAKQMDRHLRILFERARNADSEITSVLDCVAVVVLVAPLATSKAANYVVKVLLAAIQTNNLEQLSIMVEAGRVLVWRFPQVFVSCGPPPPPPPRTRASATHRSQRATPCVTVFSLCCTLSQTSP
jgi:hypothetical protein